MGNVFSIQVSFGCDAILNRCLDCTVGRAKYTRQVGVKLDALQTELQKLLEIRNDVLRRLNVAEQKHMKRTDQVQGWLSRVHSLEAEVGQLQKARSQEIENLCLGGNCSKNRNSSYKFGKKVAKRLQYLTNLKKEGVFEVVAERLPEDPVDEIQIEPTIVGLQPTFDKVWTCLGEEKVGIIGLYGTGGVGKTTLLKQINNSFCSQPYGFDVVIWSVVSKEPKFERVQEDIGKKIGLVDESWKNRSAQEKARDIFKILRKKKFVLLFDDVWDRVDLIEIGVPFPNLENESKLVFTTRDFEVCGKMEAHKSFKIEYLGDDDAWKLFQEKVGRGVLDSPSEHILELAKIIAKECAGLPLALVTIGRAMACKKSPQEWTHAIDVLRKSASKFSELEEKVYSRLKFSYDNLPSEAIRSSLLYCSLFPEDYRIVKKDLINCWIGEGFLGEFDGSDLYNQGYYIIGVLVHACLLEEEEERGYCYVKMHDVIRDMVLWIACKIEKEKENYLVQAGVGITEAPEIGKWEGVRRLSFMGNKIEYLSEAPRCFSLQTLFLNDNHLKMITSGFFQFMPSLTVLNLENNKYLTELPSEISKLVSLQYLNLTYTCIKELPIELKGLVNLKCLDLDNTFYLQTIPCQLISTFSRLCVLRMSYCGLAVHYEATEESVLFGGGEILVEELLGLKYLDVLNVSLRSSRALQKFLASIRLQSSTQILSLERFEDSKSLDISYLSELSHLDALYVYECKYLEELTIGDVKKTQEPYGFRSLQRVVMLCCSKLRDLTWLVFVPNLKFLSILNCVEIDEVIRVGTKMMTNLSPFTKLQSLELYFLPNLKSIYWEGLPFPHLKEIAVFSCPKLTKLPLHSNSAKENKIIIKGEKDWWKEMQWEDDATKNTFLPCFKSLDVMIDE